MKECVVTLSDVTEKALNKILKDEGMTLSEWLANTVEGYYT